MDLKTLGNVIASTVAETDEGMGVPSGILYAGLMGECTLNEYNAAITILKKIGLIKERYNCLHPTEKLKEIMKKLSA